MPTKINLTSFTTPKRYPVDFDNLPPNHNGIIDEDKLETFSNIHSALKLVIKVVSSEEKTGLNLTERETRGMLSLLESMADAMKYELYHRMKGE